MVDTGDVDVSSLLRPERWPVASADGWGSMRVLPSGDRHEIIRIVGALSDVRQVAPVREEFTTAVAALRDFEGAPAIGGGSAALRAATAVRRLADALTALGEDSGVRVPADLGAYLDDPPQLREDLRQSVATYLVRHAERDLDRLRTFSLILFRDTDLDGTLAASLNDHRPQWRDALTPADPGAADLHLAVIAPPTARRAVTALAEELGCEGLLPCVVFLGDRPQLAWSGGGGKLVRLAARRLVPDTNHPEQLKRIYRSVYGSRVPAPGSLWTAVGDKWLSVAAHRLNPWTAVILLLGAIGGQQLVEAAESVRDLFTR